MQKVVLLGEGEGREEGGSQVEFLGDFRGDIFEADAGTGDALESNAVQAESG